MSIFSGKETQSTIAKVVDKIFTPLVAILFLKRFSGGINLRNGLILGVFVSFGCLFLDSLVIGFIFGLGLSFLRNWLFVAVYLETLVLVPLTAAIYNQAKS